MFGCDFKVAARRSDGIHLAFKRGYADDFIDLAQACLFLTTVDRGDFPRTGIGMRLLHREFSKVSMTLRHTGVEKEAVRETAEKKERNRVLRETGLDGIAMMEVLGMEPGPEFGLALRRIHAGIFGQAKMPSFGKKIDVEIERRAGDFYNKMFEKGE